MNEPATATVHPFYTTVVYGGELDFDPTENNGILEILENGEVTAIRVLNWKNLDISFGRTASALYSSVKKMDICCPVPLNIIYEWLTYLPALIALKFDHDFFNASGELSKSDALGLPPMPFIEYFCVYIDKRKYMSYNSNEQRRVHNGINNVMDFANKIFTSVRCLDLYLPPNLSPPQN